MSNLCATACADAALALSTATQPTRELDRMIANAVGEVGKLPLYTATVPEAWRCMPPGWRIVDVRRYGGATTVEMHGPDDDAIVEQRGSSAAIAICVAAMLIRVPVAQKTAVAA